MVDELPKMTKDEDGSYWITTPQGEVIHVLVEDDGVWFVLEDGSKSKSYP